MKLREGIKIFGENPSVWISDGVRPASALPGHDYEPRAFVPRSWRIPTDAERSLLLARAEDSPTLSRSIGVVSLPSELKERAFANPVGSSQNLEEFIGAARMPEFLELQRELINFARARLETEKNFIVMSPTFNPANRETVTVFAPTGRLLGLHLDSWDHMPLTERDHASNRISINLGREDRYLLFMNLPMSSILERLLEEDRAADRAVLAFLERYPETPVMRIRIAPGEAYIAPTENMIHDGSSIDRQSADVHLTLRGYFRI